MKKYAIFTITEGKLELAQGYYADTEWLDDRDRFDSRQEAEEVLYQLYASCNDEGLEFIILEVFCGLQ